MARKKPLVLKVSPNINSDPQVKLSNRAPPADGRVKIEWRKRKNAADFDFIGFTPAPALQENGQPAQNPFKNISVNKTRIKCDFKPNQAGIEYGYTLAIEHNGVVYNTDESEDPDGGRAVIRN